MIKITTLATRYGVSTKTLRFYEHHGLIAPERKGRHRIYHPKDEARLALVMEGKSLGLTLSEIRSMIQAGADGSERLVITQDAAKRQLRVMRKRFGKALAAVAKLEDLAGERKLPSEKQLAADRNAQPRRA